MIVFIVVQCRIYGLIGCLAKDYPDCMENIDENGIGNKDENVIKIRDMYFRALEIAIINKQDVNIVMSFFYSAIILF